MPDIFISYSRVDKERATQVANALREEGLDVWWDDDLRAGESYDEVTEDNLRNAAAVIVLWSKTSSKSKWVRAEATIGERHSTLVPAVIEDCDRPLRFELIQTVDLTVWDGDRDASSWQSLVTAIRLAIGSADPANHADEVSEVKTHHNQGLSPSENAITKKDDTIEAVFWSTIKDTKDPLELEAYLKRYKNGAFVELAQTRLDRLRRDILETTVDQNELSQQADNALNQSIGSSGPEIAGGLPRSIIAIGIYASTSIIGISIFFIANILHLGRFKWVPASGAQNLITGSKEIGFYAALNWSLLVLFLMPVAWTIMYLAISEARDVWLEMVRRKMLISDDFKPIDKSDARFKKMQKHIKYSVITSFLVITTVTTALAYSDYVQVAGRAFSDPEYSVQLDKLDNKSIPLAHDTIERDWSVVSYLSSDNPDRVSVNANRIFNQITYIIYPGLGMGMLIAFGLVFIGMGATFTQSFAKTYGLMIIPDVNSVDRRRGFEVVKTYFSYGYLTAFIACVICYLMAIQNSYLRMPDDHIFSFLSPNFELLFDGESLPAKIDAIVGYIFLDTIPNNAPQNVFAWIFSFLIFVIVLGGFLSLLREGAYAGAIEAREKLTKGGALVFADFSKHENENAINQSSSIQVWPLEKPTLRTSIILALLLFSSFIFYKIGFLVIVLMAFFIPLTLLKSL